MAPWNRFSFDLKQFSKGTISPTINNKLPRVINDTRSKAIINFCSKNNQRQSIETYREQACLLNVCCHLTDRVCAHVRGDILFPVVCFSITVVGTLVSFNGRDNMAGIRPEERILPLFYLENGHSSQPVSTAVPCKFLWQNKLLRLLFIHYSIQHSTVTNM